ncbi:MAG TPA: diacylglycerol kinase family protein [Salinimicrobium sp.]|nr:diacylglycerol kinase family protein [Salinimicrobium sp.]
MSGKRILLVVNPISGGIDKTDIIDFLKDYTQKGDFQLKIFKTNGKNDKAELSKIISSFDPNRIFIAGGDGSIKLIAEIIKENPIPIAIFPAGSANGLAENFDLPSSIHELTEIAFGQNLTSIDSIMVNNEPCLHISDMGLNAELIKNYEEGNIRGKLGYLIQSIPTLIKSDFPFDFEISVDGKSFSRKAFLVGIANARKFGTGAIINPNGKVDDGKFEILVFKKFDIPQILKTFRENSRLNEDFIEIFSAEKATVNCSQKVPFQIDGEYRGELNHIKAEIAAQKLIFATPSTTLLR